MHLTRGGTGPEATQTNLHGSSKGGTVSTHSYAEWYCRAQDL